MTIDFIPGEGLFSNAYVIAAGSQALVIDPGNSLDAILKTCQERGAKLSAILLTHGHLHHAARSAELQVRTGAILLAHEKELPALMALPHQGDREGLCGVKVPVVQSFLKGGEKLNVAGCDFVIWETPGHSPGSVSFRIGGDLFVGHAKLESLSKECLSKARRIYPGHGFPFDAKELSPQTKSRRRGTP